MVYTHWLQIGSAGVRSLDDLFGGTEVSYAERLANDEEGGGTQEALL